MSLDKLKENLHMGAEVLIKFWKQSLVEYTEDGWKDKQQWEDDKYTRTLIDKKEGMYELVLFCWKKNHVSRIHDHRGSHCLMKILEGEVYEEQYKKPKEASENTQMEKDGDTINHKKGDIAHINGVDGIHRVGNKEDGNAVTLHLYFPPITKCSVYDYATSGREEIELKYD